MTIRTIDRVRWAPGALVPDALYRGSAPWPQTLVAEILEEVVAGRRQDMTLEQLMILNAIHDAVEDVDLILEDLTHD